MFHETQIARSVALKASIAHRRPATTPARRDTRANRARASGGSRDAERSPRGSTSSAIACSTASRTAWIGGSQWAESVLLVTVLRVAITAVRERDGASTQVWAQETRA